MSWFGKIIGGTVGFMLGGPIGALLVGALGHHFIDKSIENLQLPHGGFRGNERSQTAFFTATFSIMGHIAKADGRVTQDEIQTAEAVMTQMQLNAQQRELAINLFNEGKDPAFPLDGVLEQLRRECSRQRNLMQMFIEIQLHAAFSDGEMHENEKKILRIVCERLGFTSGEFEMLAQRVYAQRHFASGNNRQQTHSGGALNDAYKVLGVSSSATDDEVKRAYRRLMSQHHPDKLVAKGLPEEMMQMAKEKTQDIKAAYELIRNSRRQAA